MITAKDVRALAKNARICNEFENAGRQYVLVWRATVRKPMPAQAEHVERRFLPDEKPDHISWWIGGALDAMATLGYHKESEELSIEQV